MDTIHTNMGDKKAASAAKNSGNAGNANFKKGAYEEALANYSTAIQLDPANVMYPANKAMVHLKMEKWEEAEQDCDQAIEMDDKYAKVKLLHIWSDIYIFQLRGKCSNGGALGHHRLL